MFDRNKSKSQKNKYQDIMNFQKASLTALPLWYPFYARSLFLRAKLLSNNSQSFFNGKYKPYLGMSTALLLQPLFPATQALFNLILMRIEKMNDRHPTLTEKIVASFITGFSTTLVTNPTEVVLIAAQKQQQSPAKAFLHTLKKHGLSGFYTGGLPMGVRNGIFTIGLYFTTPQLEKIFMQYAVPSNATQALAVRVAATLPSAIIFTLAVVPLDLGFTLRQADPSQKKFKSIMEVLIHLHQKNGFSIMKTGFLYRLLATTIELMTIHSLKHWYENPEPDNHSTQSHKKK